MAVSSDVGRRKKIEGNEGIIMSSMRLNKHITFFIGNGFDINVGLHTKYSDFYDVYIKNHENDMLAKGIKEDYNNWADLELALGKYTGEVRVENEEFFWESEGLLEQELKGYFRSQVTAIESLVFLKNEISSKMQISLAKFYEDPPENHMNHFKDILNSTSCDLEYSFITFNYTNVFDQCVNTMRKNGIYYIESHKDYFGREYKHKLGQVLHIHGTIDNEMVLGVNDERQIANVRFRGNDLCRKTLIKKETNRSYGNTKVDRTQKIIDDSLIICIFGMSIGETDKMWWQYITEWLRENQDRMLVIYVRDNKAAAKYHIFTVQKKTYEKFKKNASVPEKVWEQIKDQICVKVNANMFDFRLV